MEQAKRLKVRAATLPNFKPSKLEVKPTASNTKVVDFHDDLIRACKNNDATAQQQLYMKYRVAMFNTALRILGKREDAQDALQEAFVSAFRSIENYDGRATFGAWLKRIVINKSINLLRKRDRVRFESIENKADEAAFQEQDDIAYTSEQINSAIMELPTACRAVFTMKALEGLTHQEIGHFLDISEGTSKSQFNRARKLLQEALLSLQSK